MALAEGEKASSSGPINVEYVFAEHRRNQYLAILLTLLALLPVTWATRRLAVDAQKSDVRNRQLDVVDEAHATIQDDFRSIEARLLAEARQLASNRDVVQSMRSLRSDRAPAEALVRSLADIQPRERTTLEVYDPTPRLVAWSGFSLPVDDAPSRPRFLEGIQSAIATDGDRRVALVVWVPVSDGVRAMGAVRAMHILELRVPVENRFLKPYSQASQWSRRTGSSVRVLYDAPFDDELPARGEVRLLTGIDGSPLARVFVEPPAPEELAERVADRFDDVMAMWEALILFWLAGGVWFWYTSYRGGTLRMRNVRFAFFAASWAVFRYALLALNVPARYQPGKSPLAALFDPTHLASSLAGGVARSIGDLLVTSIFLLVLAIAALRHVAARREETRAGPSGAGPLGLKTVGRGIALGACLILLAFVGAVFARSAVLDSTLDYFTRSGLVPPDLVLLVFTAQFVIVLALAMLGIACTIWALGIGSGLYDRTSALQAGGAALVAAFVAHLVIPGDVLTVPISAGFAGSVLGATMILSRREERGVSLLTLRHVLPGIFVVTLLAYPMLQSAVDVQRKMRIVDAAETYEDGRDPRALYAVDRALRDARTTPDLIRSLEGGPVSQVGIRLDSMATALLRTSFLASLGSYEISMTVHEASGVPLGRYYEAAPRMSASALDELELEQFSDLRRMYAEAGEPEVLVEPITGRQDRDRFEYHGLTELRNPQDVRLGWIVVRAEPRSLLQEAGTPFPKVLVPAGSYGNLQRHIEVAVFRNRNLVRSTGDAFGRYRLSDEIADAVSRERELWFEEEVQDTGHLTYYRLQEPSVQASGRGAADQIVIAARTVSLGIFDHLYNLLRLTFGGLVVGVPLYLLGLAVRRGRGLLPLPRVQFRDKVLNAFFAVGMITVAAMGVVGLNVVTGENERAVESWLRQHLERVERAIVIESEGGELAYHALERMRVDSLAARVGLDINIYRHTSLIASSRPQLVTEQLVDQRMPMDVYEALYLDGYRFAHSEQRIGSFSFTAGFRALPNESGEPHFVISVPTLPEQEQIDEERARTVAYLFGALLLLVFVVLITASLLANALTRPILRLRRGIEAVGRGRFERIQPVASRDEIGELVESFNSMQRQLSDSRRKLARQERQLAWREMARQVAHEIKNPLTPMRLSVQHLRRSFEESDGTGDRFGALFRRITTTLVEQIDSLARIANEFSTFARMPQRIEEVVDVNAVAEEAVALMAPASSVSIKAVLSEEPLPVRADREELRRVFINLIKNAVQSIPDERHGEVSVTTRLERDEDAPRALASVRDNGMGIDQEAQSRIFVPNFSTKTSGTGLGLAIAKKSVEELTGEIGFDTQPGKGSTFWIRLPLVTDPQAA